MPAIPGVIELAPAYTSVAVFFDPIVVAKVSGKTGRGVRLAGDNEFASAIVTASGRSSRAGPRADEPLRVQSKFQSAMIRNSRSTSIAWRNSTKLSASEVVDLHSGSEYRVACIGFVPGFPFLAGLPKNLATPRRDVPRKEIPAGSVGIGGAQTGIYPLRSPGGWNLIGRTPLKLFDPTKDPPTLLCPGDRVRFRAITREQF